MGNIDLRYMGGIINEKDREQTKKRLLDALGSIIKNEGFAKIGVNSIAAKAGVSKVLIYRYFGSIEDMVVDYLSENDFWATFSVEFPKNEDVKEYLKKVFRNQISQLKHSALLKELYRLELTYPNPIIEKLRLKREAKAMTIINIVGQLAGKSTDEVASLSAILSASISNLVLLSETCPIYNGIDIQHENGWEQLLKGFDMIIDSWFDYKS